MVLNVSLPWSPKAILHLSHREEYRENHSPNRSGLVPLLTANSSSVISRNYLVPFPEKMYKSWSLEMH